MNTTIKRIQTVIFTKNFTIANDAERARFFLSINDNPIGNFNLPPTQLPIPNEAPPEFPRVILNGSNISCNIALSRTDVVYNVPAGDNTNINSLSELQKINASNIFNFLLGKSIIINRIGFIIFAQKVLLPEDGDAFKYLKDSFIKDAKFPSPKELSFRYNSVGKAGNFDMNNLITISAKSQNTIDLQTDINTVAEIMNITSINYSNFVEIIEYGINKSVDFINNFPNI